MVVRYGEVNRVRQTRRVFTENEATFDLLQSGLEPLFQLLEMVLLVLDFKPGDLRGLARRFAQLLPREFHQLGDLLRWAEGGGGWPRITSNDPAYFYTLRATPGKDRDLVNQLLAELSPLDVRQLFICHKQLFYDRYATWPEEKKEFVADFLEREYQVDKAGAREALFGPEDAMEEPEPKPAPSLVDAVGPWGAVRRGR